MHDPVLETARDGGIIFHEEVARDGAQGKTLLLGGQRSEIVRQHSSIFGSKGRQHLVFNAGFPSIGKEEFDTIRQVVNETDHCTLCVCGRLAKQDIDLMRTAVKGAQHGRIVLTVPLSDRTSHTLMHTDVETCVRTAVELAKYALDFGDVLVDFAMVDIVQTPGEQVMAYANRLFEVGASMAILCDTVGSLSPLQANRFFADLQASTEQPERFIVHMHNDLGYGLANTVAALAHGIRGLTSCWLSLGERAGMPSTEQLLFSVGYQPAELASRFGADIKAWDPPLDLKKIAPLSHLIGTWLGIQPRMTDPIVGGGVNSISTGTPFTNPDTFRPFDPDRVLGIPQTIHLTQMASLRIIDSVAASMGITLQADETLELQKWIKSEAYRRGMAIIEPHLFRAQVEAMRNSGAEALEISYAIRR